MKHSSHPHKKIVSTILLAEDDRVLSEMYTAKFKASGFRVILAEDGVEALRLAREEHPDIALLDVMMPKKEGTEVVMEMKEDPKLRDIPVIFLTNLGGRKEDTEAGIALGAIEVITKAEATPQKIVDRVTHILGKY